MNAVLRPENPFVGPSPIPQSARLFARDVERRNLVDMLVAERFVLLFGPTGVGKTSLINAGVIADFRAKKVSCPPIVKLEAKEVPEGVNPFLASLYSQLFQRDTPKAPLPPNLAEALDEALHGLAGQRILVIVDTLEQIFTHSLQASTHASEFLHVLESLHCQHFELLLLVVMREEFIGRLEGLTRPVRTGARLRLGPLRGDRACEAIERTALQSKVKLSADYLAPIVRQLAGFADVRAAPDAAANSSIASDARLQDLIVEPVYLQLTCYNNWHKLVDAADRLARGESLSAAAISVGDSIDGYVETVIGETCAAHPLLNERALRTFLAEELVAPNGELDSVRPDQAEDVEISLNVLKTLEERKLIRLEPRSGRDEYELSHYLIAQAVTRRFRNWSDANLHPFQFKARQYATSGDSKLLLDSSELIEARRWIDSHAELESEHDTKFLAASRKAVLARWRTGRGIVSLVLAAVLLIGLTGVVVLSRHREALHEYTGRVNEASYKLDRLSPKVEHGALNASQLATLEDHDAARSEALLAIEDYDEFRNTKAPTDNPELSASFVTRFFRKLAVMLGYEEVDKQVQDVAKKVEAVGLANGKSASREMVADVVASRFIATVADRLAPVGSEESLAVHLRGIAIAKASDDDTIVAAAASWDDRYRAYANARGEVTITDSEAKGFLPSAARVVVPPVRVKGLSTTGLFFADTSETRPLLLVRFARRYFAKFRLEKEGGDWVYQGYFGAPERDDEDVLDSQIVPNSTDQAVCLVSVPASAGDTAIMAGSVRAGQTCAQRVPIFNLNGLETRVLEPGAEFVRVSSTGRYVFVGGGSVFGALLGRDPQTERMYVLQIEGAPRNLIAAEFDAEERRLALADRTGRILVYSLLGEPGEAGSYAKGAVEIQSRSSLTTSLAFVGQHWLVAGGVSQKLSLFDLDSGRVERLLPGFSAPPVFISVTNSGDRRIAAGAPDGKLLFWSIDDLSGATPSFDYSVPLSDFCADESRCRGHERQRSEGATALAFDREIEQLAVGFEDGRVMLMDSARRVIAVLGEPQAPLDAVTRVAFSPDGKLLATAYMRGRIRIFDVERGTTIEVGEHPRVTGLGFPDDTTLISAGLDQRRGWFSLAADRRSVREMRFFPAAAGGNDRTKQWNSLAIDRTTGTVTATRNSGAVVFEAGQWTRDEVPRAIAEQFRRARASDRILTANRFGALVAEGSEDGIQRIQVLDRKKPSMKIFGGSRKEIVRQFWDSTGTLLFAIDANGMLRVTDAVRMRPVLSLELPIALEAPAPDQQRKLFAQDMHVACKRNPEEADQTKQFCVIAATLGARQTRIELLALDMRR